MRNVGKKDTRQVPFVTTVLHGVRLWPTAHQLISAMQLYSLFAFFYVLLISR